MSDDAGSIVRLSTIQPQSVDWLWRGRIPLGELTLMDGDPSCNKSSLVLDLAARISTGRTMPDGTTVTTGTVLLFMAEDSYEKTIVQRLNAAKADLENICTMQELISLPDDLSKLEMVVAKVRPRLVVIDPLTAFLSCNINNDQSVRRALGPLKRMAERCNCAIVMVRHLTKQGRASSLYRGSGSIGVIAATRSAFLIGKSPNDPEFRAFCHTKCNLAPLAPSLLFEPVTSDGSVAIEWRGECDITAEDILKPKPDNSQLHKAMTFLAQLLADGPEKQTVIRQKASAAGIALRTLERAKELLSVQSKRQGFGPGSSYYWKLPNDDTAWSANTADVADHGPLIIRPPEFFS